jgi:hypothetical protein
MISVEPIAINSVKPSGAALATLRQKPSGV